MTIIRNIALGIVLLFSLYSCDKRNDDLWNLEKDQIRNYLLSLGITDFTEDESAGYFYYFTDLDSISGGRPNVNSTIEVHYDGKIFNDGIFYQTTPGQTERILLSSSIVGWQLGLQNFFIGSSGVLIIPSRLAYGKDGLYDEYGNELVPPNSILVFEIDLVEVHPHF